MTKEEIEQLGDDYEVCQCMAITLGELKEAIKNGATTLEALTEKTEAGVVCELCVSSEIDEDEEREVHLDEIIAAYTSGNS